MTDQSASETDPPKVRTVRLAEITIDTRFQTRALHAPTVKAYENVLRGGGTFPPLLLGDIDGRRVLLGGWHRCAAYAGRGVLKAQAVVVKTTEREAAWLGAQDNLRNARPLSTKDRRHAFRFFIKARAHIEAGGQLNSYRDIARALGGTVTHHTIRNWMIRMYPKIAEQMRKVDDDERPGTARPSGTLARAHLQDALAGLRTAECASLSLEGHPEALEELRGRVDEFARALRGLEKVPSGLAAGEDF